MQAVEVLDDSKVTGKLEKACKTVALHCGDRIILPVRQN